MPDDACDLRPSGVGDEQAAAQTTTLMYPLILEHHSCYEFRC